MKLIPHSAPHTHSGNAVSNVMLHVIIALAPATLFGIYIFGFPALNIIVLTILVALLAEAFSLYVANKAITPHLLDGSAFLTGLLLAMSLPPWAPWWIAVFGGVFAIIIGKHIFGGLGQNVFNPAMLARVALLISFPLEMTTWVDIKPLFSSAAPDFLESLKITFYGIPDFDSVSSASQLGHLRTELTMDKSAVDVLNTMHYSASDSMFGMIGGSIGETSSLLILLGGIYLLYKRIISWHIPFTMIATIFVLSLTFHLIDNERFADPIFHIFSGGFLLGAFFIATDLVTSPNTKLGQIIFAVGIAVLDYVIRTWGGYPEGMGFAVLLMNA
ncbi:MAG: RnfABCDGE type electron transport complex subunit D, partial [Gammaproteobacteria bacterium]|nr:RnfABCDGE type electron transport complex subunit D [Gammaproteobacteria bacterium]